MEFIADLLYDLPKNYGLAFDIVHYIVCLQAERLDMGLKFSETSQNHPLACWLAAFFTSFAGGFLVAPLCGEPVLDAVNDPMRLVIFTILWYLLYYTPGDIVYKASKMLPVKLILYVLKGMYYPKKIVAGIKHAKHVFHGNLIAHIVIATLKANGSGFMKPAARFLRGNTENITGVLESMKPSVTTKYCLICAILYIFVPGDLIYIIICGLLVTMKAGPLFAAPVDVFKPLEDRICPLLFNLREEKPDEKKQD